MWLLLEMWMMPGWTLRPNESPVKETVPGIRRDVGVTLVTLVDLRPHPPYRPAWTAAASC
jgi:hypothetical protein